MNSTTIEGSGLRSASLHTSRRRYTVLRDPPVWPFVWRGLLPLLGLLLLAWYAITTFARTAIEAPTREQVRAALLTQGYDGVDVRVSGQHVVLSGRLPAGGSAAAALDLARTAQCGTWLGRRTCAVDVHGSFTEAAPVVEPAPAPAAAPVERAAAAEPAPIAAPDPCEAEFSRVLAGSRIRFATAKADIRPESSPLLDQLAQIAENCSGTVQIEGHTDSIGAPEMNQMLSEARAYAVREALISRGLAAERLSARGFGATQPIADNETSSGRAANRRIEFRSSAAPR